jgi:hypothetical protein
LDYQGCLPLFCKCGFVCLYRGLWSQIYDLASLTWALWQHKWCCLQCKLCCSANYVFDICWIHMKTLLYILANYVFYICWLKKKLWAIHVQPIVFDMYCFKRLVLYGHWEINYIISMDA